MVIPIPCLFLVLDAVAAHSFLLFVPLMCNTCIIQIEFLLTVSILGVWFEVFDMNQKQKIMSNLNRTVEHRIIVARHEYHLYPPIGHDLIC